METKRPFIPKRPHRKSRKGCKQRKQKCDERHPICSPCEKRSVLCTYAPRATTAENTNSNSHSLQRKTPPSWCPQAGPDSLTFKSESDARIFHYFVSRAGLLMRSKGIDPGARELFAEYVPQLAHNDRALMNVLLSIGSAHLSASGTIVTPESMQQRSLRAYSDAIAEYRSSIDSTGNFNKNVEIFYALTLLLATRACINVGETCDSAEVFFESLCSWFTISRGHCILSERILPRLEGTHFKAILQRNPGYSIDEAVLLAQLSERGLSRFQNLVSAAQSQDKEVEAAFATVVLLLEWINAAVVERMEVVEIFRRWKGASLMLPAKFVEMLRDRQPLAIVITAHYYAFAHHVAKIWWPARNAQEKVLMLMTLVPPQWLPSFDGALGVMDMTLLEELDIVSEA